jgi:hypothetical protein
MQQRRVRLGDVLDDYCPRERRITNHAVVAMIEDEVKQTRCTTCDTEHEYKHAKIPAPRRKKPPAAAIAASVEPVEAPTLVAAEAIEGIEELPLEPIVEAADAVDAVDTKEAETTVDAEEPLSPLA